MTRARVLDGLAMVPCPWEPCRLRSVVRVVDIPALPQALVVHCVACANQMVVIALSEEVVAARFTEDAPS